jgi:tetratricopeptide (TPR) repeat protein
MVLLLVWWLVELRLSEVVELMQLGLGFEWIQANGRARMVENPEFFTVMIDPSKVLLAGLLMVQLSLGLDGMAAYSGVSRPVLALATTAEDYFTQAAQKYTNGDAQGALADYTQAIKLNPKFAFAYYNRGNIWGDLGDYKRAIADYTQAIKHQPDADMYNNRGAAQRDLGNHQAAIDDYSQAIQLNPNYVDAYYNRGTSRGVLGNAKGAMADLTQAIKLKPDYAEAYNNRGPVRRSLGDAQGAIADYNRAIELKPDLADAYYNRGNIWDDLGEAKRAIEDFQKAADLYQQQGKSEDYQDALNQIKKLQ